MLGRAALIGALVGCMPFAVHHLTRVDPPAIEYFGIRSRLLLCAALLREQRLAHPSQQEACANTIEELFKNPT